MRSGRISAFNVTAVALGLAFLYLPIVILVIYSFNASRLVTVWGGWSTRWYVELLQRPRHAGRGLDEPARSRCCRRRAATVLGTLAAVALVRGGRFRGRTAVLRHGLCAAGDAGGDHRACRCCCCSSRSTSIAASGP